MATEATRLQELKHMIRHFIFIYLVIKWVNLYMPIRTFFFVSYGGSRGDMTPNKRSGFISTKSTTVGGDGSY